MALIVPAHVDGPFRFRLREPQGRLPYPLLVLEAGAVGYGERTVLTGFDLSLAPGERIGLLGPNGAGKSTLIRLFAGVLPSQASRRLPTPGLRVVISPNTRSTSCGPTPVPIEHLRRLAPDHGEQELRGYLGGFAFSGGQATAATAPFSGSEKARLALVLPVWQRPNLLVLDEPTNHLDLRMRHALSLALQKFEGALVLVSHDRHLLRVTSDQLLLVDVGTVTGFAGDFDNYPA